MNKIVIIVFNVGGGGREEEEDDHEDDRDFAIGFMIYQNNPLTSVECSIRDKVKWLTPSPPPPSPSPFISNLNNNNGDGDRGRLRVIDQKPKSQSYFFISVFISSLSKDSIINKYLH